MALEQFHLVKEICSVGLVHMQTPEFRQTVAQLRNALARESKEAREAVVRNRAREQAAMLNTLLERFQPSVPSESKSRNGRAEAEIPRMRPDTIQLLLRKGRLEHEHGLAAEEISEIYGALLSGFSATVSASNPMRTNLRQSGPWRIPFDHLPQRLIRLYYDHYRPWSEQIKDQRCGTMPLSELTTEVVVNGRSLHEIERSQNLRNGSASEPLQRSLRIYAEIAGWLSPEPGRPRKKPPKRRRK